MGCWGVKATECDCGLDLLYGAITSNLLKKNFKQFNVKELMAVSKKHIIDGIKEENKGCSKADMEMYIDSNFPYSYDHAVMLMAECLVDFFNNGEVVAAAMPRHLTVPRIGQEVGGIGENQHNAG
jgi:hypothetical protein